MSAQKTEPDSTDTTFTNIDSADIANSGPFMESLVTFLHEACSCMEEVKQRAGMSPGCGSSVRMNDEEKQEKLGCIISTLAQKCKLEVSKNQESLYQTAESSGAGYATANSSLDPCYCPPGMSMRNQSSRQMSRGRRADTPRPGTTPIRGRVATPDNYFVPLNQSTPTGYGRPCPSGRSGSSSKGRSTSPYGYQSGTGAYPSNSLGEIDCPPECSQSIKNSTGRQEYRRLRGQDPSR